MNNYEILNWKNKIKKLNNKINSFISYSKDDFLIKYAGNKKIKDIFKFIIGIKDNIAVQGMPLTAGSKMLKNFEDPLYNASVVDKLKTEGYINLGKLNMDEFAMGSTSSTSFFGATCNPFDTELVPGGSSGGSAAAVASGMVNSSLGTDTGGSVRQPSSFNNIVGIKPTYGRVSRFGVISFASSLDQVGVLSNTVYDNSKILSVISGKDEKDYTTFEHKIDFIEYAKYRPTQNKIAVFRHCFDDFNHKDVIEILNNTIDIFKKNGFEVDVIDFSPFNILMDVYTIISTTEASSSLARYNGLLYGLSYDEKKLEDIYYKTRDNGFGEEVKKRIILGKYLLASKDNLYEKALIQRRNIFNIIKDILLNYEIIMTPTTPILPFSMSKVEEKELRFSDFYTVIANLTGLPSISVPSGFSKKSLPIGIQFIAPEFEEKRLYYYASIIEEEVKCYKIKPKNYCKVD